MDTGEFDLIEKIKNIVGNNNDIVGIGDDCAVISSLSVESDILITTDILAEGIHFDLDYTPFVDLGRKSALVNASDILAMGGRLSSFTVSLSIPSYISSSDIEDFYRGFKQEASRFSAAIVGGDTTGAKNGFVISITALGFVKKGKAILRSTAKTGDNIYVLGSLGESAYGLEYLTNLDKEGMEGEALKTEVGEEENWAVLSHLTPSVEYEMFHDILMTYSINSAIDVSDGLLSDLEHILRQSGKAAVLYENADFALVSEIWCLVKEGLILKEDALNYILNGGEDYAILFTSPDNIENGDSLIKIGEIVEGDSISLKRENGSIETVKGRGFRHF